MAAADRSIVIVGSGPGSADYITPAARKAAADADVLIGFPRMLAMFPDCGRERIAASADIPQLLDQVDALRQAGRQVVMLVSGDPGMHSVAADFVRRFGRQNCRLVPAISSVQVAFERLGLSWHDAYIISAHGRIPDESPFALAGYGKIAILAGTAQGLKWAAGAAAAVHYTHDAYLMENLTMGDETIRKIKPEELAVCCASSLAMVLLVRKELLQ